MSSTPLQHRHLRKSFAGTVLESPINPRVAFIRHEDEEAQRHKRRSDAAAAAALNESSSTGTKNLVGETEIKQHFEICSQLYTQGKINIKNAWKLQVIQLLYQVTDKASTNVLQVITTPLEIGAKVYGIKVDDVHSTGLKLANTISQNLEAANNKSAEDDEEHNETVERRRKTRKKRTPRSTLMNEKDLFAPIKQMEPVDFQIKEDPKKNVIDNLFTNIFPQHPAGHTFKMCNKDKAWIGNNDEDPTLNCQKSYSFVIDIPKIEEMPICLPFKAFSLDKWNPEDEDARLSLNPPSPEKRLEVFCDEDGIPIHELDGSIHEFNGEEFNNDLDDNGDVENLPPQFQQPHHPVLDHIYDISEVRPEDFIKTEYSYSPIDSILGNHNGFLTRLWAGPSHWKAKFIKRKTTRFAGSSLSSIELVNKQGPKASKKKKKVDVLPDFKQKQDFQCDILKIKKKPLSVAPEKLVLPILSQRSFQDLGLHIFLRPGIYPNKKNSSNATEPEIATNTSTYNYNNPNDSMYCNENGVDNGDYGDVEEEEIAIAGQCQALTGENLVDKPEIVSIKDGIQFAIKAKRIDMNKLKKTIWMILKREEAINTTFVEVYKEIPNHLPSDMKKELSVHLAFSALLHLCNEHSLSLETISRNNFKIMQV